MLNIPDFNDCGKSICEKKDVKYKVLIHDSKKTLNSDLQGTEYPSLIVEADKDPKGSISKLNLDSISTNENSCAADETSIRDGCQVKKVIKSDLTEYCISGPSARYNNTVTKNTIYVTCLSIIAYL